MSAIPEIQNFTFQESFSTPSMLIYIPDQDFIWMSESLMCIWINVFVQNENLDPRTVEKESLRYSIGFGCHHTPEKGSVEMSRIEILKEFFCEQKNNGLCSSAVEIERPLFFAKFSEVSLVFTKASGLGLGSYYVVTCGSLSKEESQISLITRLINHIETLSVVAY